jgi:hypothetical protein
MQVVTCAIYKVLNNVISAFFIAAVVPAVTHLVEGRYKRRDNRGFGLFQQGWYWFYTTEVNNPIKPSI